MKRLITAASFAVLALPAAAAEYGKPFEQAELDRALPSISVPVAQSATDSGALPYEQAQADRLVPSFGEERIHVAAAAGSTMSDASTDASEPSAPAVSPWANDHNFIAPPQ